MAFPKTQDPTAEEMRAFLKPINEGYGGDEGGFDVEAAIYWFAHSWHGGQSSNLYSTLSTSPYTPGPCTEDPSGGDDVVSWLIAELAQEYT